MMGQRMAGRRPRRRMRMPYSGLKCSHCSAVSMEQRRMAKVTLPKEGKQVKWSPLMKSAVYKQTFCIMGGRRKYRVM